MSYEKAKGALKELATSLSQAREGKIESIDQLPAKTLTSFQQARHQALCASVSTAKTRFVRYAKQLIDDPIIEHELARTLKSAVKDLDDTERVEGLMHVVDTVAGALALHSETQSMQDFVLPKRTPHDIYDELEADAKELRACLKARCFRSVVIIAGRLLEVALHRKYYEATGNDLLEKSPGIGLGNLIGKLADKGVLTDPALGNQIHLINGVRVFSVHKKREAFRPTESQARAIALYTFDVLERLFDSKVEHKPLNA